MKINIPILLYLCSFSLTACGSDNLTKAKAEAIIKECQTEETAIRTKTFYYGTVEIDDLLKAKFPDKMKPYEKYEELGILNIGPLKRVKGILKKKDQYEVSLTEKGKELLVKSEELYRGKTKGEFKLCEYKFDSVTEIHEIPDQNIAKVKVRLTRFNETAFFEKAHEKRNPKEMIKTVTFRKTNEGWKLCDR